MSLDLFSDAVRAWFQAELGQPSAPQSEGWPAIASGSDTLISAPTGSGKTLAAFLWSIDQLVRRAEAGDLGDRTHVIYVSPLKALGNDIRKNLELPLAGIRALARAAGRELPEIRVAVRSGDTPAGERQRMVQRPPHILITTPESLFILLTAARSLEFMRTAQMVIVDEIHAIAPDKRGAHLALSLERLDRAAGRRLQRVGLSATQRPVEDVARLLVGTERVLPGGGPDCAIIDTGHRRDWDLSVWTPSQPLGPVASNELRGEVLDEIARLSRTHRTTLVFVNTRRLVERVAHQLTERLGQGQVAAHHGSLSRERRLEAEEGLKSGRVPVVVATASLELGIDIGHVDLVCHLGAPRSIATMLQRVGRAGHRIDGVPRGVLFPLTRDELMQCAACVRAATRGELDRLLMPERPLDVLAQQLVAECAGRSVPVEELWSMALRAHPYRALQRHQFDAVLEMLCEGISTSRGRRSAWLHRDQVNGTVRGRRGARLAAVTSGGAIPDVADYDVIEDPSETLVGRINEDFAIESMAGDVFLLGNTSWRIRRVEAGRVRVTDAQGAPPSVPFWLGEAPARSRELSEAIAELRAIIAAGLADLPATVERLTRECGVGRGAAEQLVEYVKQTVSVLGCVPTTERVVAERFFDESGGMQLVVHAPFGARINRAWGLALRKRFCVTFDFELQAAATDDGIVLSLGEQHSFPLDTVFAFVRSGNLREALVQATLQSPVFGTRFRWNASRSLALIRHQGGRRVPMPIQRMRSDDLLAAVFPDQVACQDNHAGGPIVPPDHPLVNETMGDCLTEWMDIEGLGRVISAIENGELETVAVETPEPSPMSHEILNANPYAFLDDAPLEERRARAVALRRIDTDLARGPGSLDADAIAEVVSQAAPDIRDADELHDHLLSVMFIGMDDPHADPMLAGELLGAGRADVVKAQGAGWLVATERRAQVEARDGETIRRGLLAWLEHLGPVTTDELCKRLGLTAGEVDIALAHLEAQGTVLRGSFRPQSGPEWCERRLLARIHRLTVQQLRREIIAVSPADHMRFLLRWQHLDAEARLHGREGVVQVVRQLQGMELPAPSWEAHILPARVRGYRFEDLEHLTLSGMVTWGRLTPDPEDVPEDESAAARRASTTRSTPISFLLRESVEALVPARTRVPSTLSATAQAVVGHLQTRGASFLTDIARGLRLLPVEVEDALWELVSAGLVTGDGVAGLRHLLNPHRSGSRSISSQRALPAGRWTLWRQRLDSDQDAPDHVEAFARQLLQRYGVVFRELAVRERRAPAWRLLVNVYRRLEMRQEIRGGRFVSGYVGEQYALPEAVESLRSTRRRKPDGSVIIVSAADPLNLTGILHPGERLPPLSGDSIAYRDGVIVDIGPLGEIRSRLTATGQLTVAATG